MLQNDLVLIERERKKANGKTEWERREDKVGMQCKDEQVHWFYFIER